MAGKFEIKRAKDGQYFFNLKAGNGQVILSSELYAERRSAENGIESIRKNAPNDARYARRTSNSGKPFFALTATNGQDIGRSELYESEAARDNGIESVKKNAPDASVEDATAG
jgi:uncharacterized protein YegP (UPF0339 family)